MRIFLSVRLIAGGGHRGEMIVYLRATGNKVPGMYGPTYEESAPGK